MLSSVAARGMRAEADEHGNAAMHSHATVDFEIVLSGKIGIVLQGNQ